MTVSRCVTLSGLGTWHVDKTRLKLRDLLVSAFRVFKIKGLDHNTHLKTHFIVLPKAYGVEILDKYAK